MKNIRTKGISIGGVGASRLRKLDVRQVTITPAQVNANSVSAQNFSVRGLKKGDQVEVNPGVSTIGVSGTRVTAEHTLTVIFTNPTAGNITPAASTWTIKATRS